MYHTAIVREEIVNGLQAIGLGRGMAVEVHCALSQLGWVEGGAEAVIEALIDVVGLESTLLMSAYPVSPALPLSEEETARGIT